MRAVTIVVAVQLNAPHGKRSHDVLENVVTLAIAHALDACDHNITQAALRLGTSRQSLQRRMRKLGLR